MSRMKGTARAALAMFAALCTTVAVAPTSDALAPAHPEPWVVYESDLRGDQFGGQGVFLVHPDGTGDHEIATDLTGDRVHPSWSADGRHLFFAADVGDYRDLFVADSQGRDVHAITTCRGTCLGQDYPSLDASGRELTDVQFDFPIVNVGPTQLPAYSHLQIARFRPDGLRDVRTLVSVAAPFAIDEARWSPDGGSLVFWEDHTNTSGRNDGSAIFTVRADGTHLRRLTPWAMVAGEADWSPDGTQIVFDTYPLLTFSLDPVVSNLYVMRPDGAHLHPLTASTTYHDRYVQPRYTRDGSIVYMQATDAGRQLYLRTAGRTIALASGGRRIKAHPDLQPSRQSTCR